MTVFRVKKILFDLDGTLVNTAADLHAATNHVLTSVGRPKVTLCQVQNMTGYGAVRLIETGLEATGGLQGLDIENLRQKFLDFYAQNICVHSNPYPNCIEMLQHLAAKNFRMAICTNKPVIMANALLRSLDLDTYFSAVIGGDSLPFKKPDGRHLLETSALLQGKGSSIMIGDSAPDVLGAKSAKLPIIAVDFGYSTKPIAELNPDYVISSLAEIPSLLAYG